VMEIRRCRASELQQVMAFIRDHWAQNHVLAHSKSLMDFQHGDPVDGDHSNWLIALNEGQLAGVLGYIPTRIYDEALRDHSILWLALWKLDETISNAGLGIKMLRAMEKIERSEAIGVLGINATHPPMYRALGYMTGELSQFVLFGDVGAQTVASVPETFSYDGEASGKASLVRLGSDDLEASFGNASLGDRAAQLPQKSASYFRQRYLDHPVYDYRIFQINIDDVSRGIIVTRMASYNGTHVLRIVDAYCDPLAFQELNTALRGLVKECGAEYVDIWQHGIPDQNLETCGFHKVDLLGDLIVPNFFEPFVLKNGRIEFAMKIRGDESFVLFRGDGDQDRPNETFDEGTLV